MMEVTVLECPNCGRSLSPNMKKCPACDSEIVISSFTSVYSMPMASVNKYANAYRKALSENPNDQSLNNAIAMCYLKLKLYDKALPAFEKAMVDNFDNSDTFFYAAVCLLKGKKAFLTPRNDIDKIEEYINAACVIEPKGYYYLFAAYIKKDYFERKFLNTNPSSSELQKLAFDHGCTDVDKHLLFETLGVACPF